MQKIRCPHCKGLNHAKLSVFSANGRGTTVTDKTILNGDPENIVDLASFREVGMYACLACGTTFLPQFTCKHILDIQSEVMEQKAKEV